MKLTLGSSLINLEIAMHIFFSAVSLIQVNILAVFSSTSA